MRHRINGCLINLRLLTDEELQRLVDETDARRERVIEEMESLMGEQTRRHRPAKLHLVR